MADLALRRAALHELIDLHHDRMRGMEAVVKRTNPDLIHNALIGQATWNAQALTVLLQIELDRIESFKGHDPTSDTLDAG